MEKRDGLNSEERMSKKFIAKEQSGGTVAGKLLEGNLRRKRGFWLNPPISRPDEHRSGWPDIPWGPVEDEGRDQISE